MIREPRITQLIKQPLWDFCGIPEDTVFRISGLRKKGKIVPYASHGFQKGDQILSSPTLPPITTWQWTNWALLILYYCFKPRPHLTTMIYCIENYGCTERWRQKFFCIPDKTQIFGPFRFPLEV